jgi:hypothetical protein
MKVIRRVTRVIKLVVFAGVALVIAILVGLGLVKKEVDAPPSSTLAPYLVQTSSRIYLGEELTSAKGYPELTDYWYLQGGKYHYVKGSIGFPTDQYGQVEVVSRFNSGS